MIGESLLGLAAVLACTAGFIDADAWQAHYASWDMAKGLGTSMAAFINGSAMFLNELGVPQALGQTFVALVAVSFALTTLDLRDAFYCDSTSRRSPKPRGCQRWAIVWSPHCSPFAAIGFFAFYEIDGKPAGLALWALFGTTNQILGGLTLLTVTLYLVQRKRNYWCTFIPMVFMLVTTVAAMSVGIMGFLEQKNYLLLVVGSTLAILALWLMNRRRDPLLPANVIVPWSTHNQW